MEIPLPNVLVFDPLTARLYDITELEVSKNGNCIQYTLPQQRVFNFMNGYSTAMYEFLRSGSDNEFNKGCVAGFELCLKSWGLTPDLSRQLKIASETAALNRMKKDRGW